MGARMESYSMDSVIFKEGEMCKKMFIILEGQVVLYHNYKKDDEYILGACGKGKTFGEMNLFTKEPCLYTAVAFSDVKLAWFERNNLDSFIKGYPEDAINLFEKLAKSYTLLGKNLQMAIEEIEYLKYRMDAESKENSIKANKIEEEFKADIDNQLEKKVDRAVLEASLKRAGSYRYIESKKLWS